MTTELYRAAGQAVAAYLYGAEIVDVTRGGITLFWDHRTPRRNELAIELVVGLAGVAAMSRYRFGSPGRSDAVVVSWRFDETERDDFGIAHALDEDLVALGHEDVFFQAWQQALEVVDIPVVWEAIERIAPHLETATLGELDVIELIDEANAVLDTDLSETRFGAALGY
jgi:hypothetical protein